MRHKCFVNEYRNERPCKRNGYYKAKAPGRTLYACGVHVGNAVRLLTPGGVTVTVTELSD